MHIAGPLRPLSSLATGLRRGVPPLLTGYMKGYGRDAVMAWPGLSPWFPFTTTWTDEEDAQERIVRMHG